MAAYFLDSSALVKRFIGETGSGWVISLFRGSAGHTFFLARVTPVEAIAGLAKRKRTGDLTEVACNKASRRLLRGLYDRFGFAEIGAALIEEAIVLAQHHGLRGFDAIQLAAAIRIEKRRNTMGGGNIIFVSADSDLNKAALAEGLIVENPNNHP